jgi:hypothetical protein
MHLRISSHSVPRLPPLRPTLPRTKTAPAPQPQWRPLCDLALSYHTSAISSSLSKADGHKAKALSSRLRRRRRDDQETAWFAIVHRCIVSTLAQRGGSPTRRCTPEDAQRRRAFQSADRELVRRLGALLAERGYWARARDFPLPPAGMPRAPAFGLPSPSLGHRKETSSPLMATITNPPLVDVEPRSVGTSSFILRAASSSTRNSFIMDEDTPPVEHVVAHMTLRFRDRCASRPRPRGAQAFAKRSRPSPSPLGIHAFVVAEIGN